MDLKQLLNIPSQSLDTLLGIPDKLGSLLGIEDTPTINPDAPQSP